MDPIETPSHFDLGHRVADAEARFVREESAVAGWLERMWRPLAAGFLAGVAVVLVLLWLI